VFASLLDDRRGGRCALAPVTPAHHEADVHTGHRHPRHAVLSESGIAEVVDFMPIDRPHVASDRRRIVRAVRGIRGEFEASVEPRFDYGRRSHRLHVDGTTAVFKAGDQRLQLSSVAALEPDDDDVRSRFAVGAGGPTLCCPGVIRARRVGTARRRLSSRTQIEARLRILKNGALVRLTATALRGCNLDVGTEREVVGREVELDRLDRLIDGAVEHGGALLVIGDPGIGKSTLLRAAADHAGAAGFLVLGTTGVESEAALPYAGLYDLLRPALDGLDALPPAQRDALSKAFGIVVGSTPEPFLVALATLNLLAELGMSRPLFVGVDDVQWLDGPTQAALAFVARRVSGDPIVVVGTTRLGFSGPFHAAGLENSTSPNSANRRPARCSKQRVSASAEQRSTRSCTRRSAIRWHSSNFRAPGSRPTPQ
jgi:hypothetical protein